MKDNFLEVVQNRRTNYTIGNEEIVSSERIQSLLEFAVEHTPSAFNSQPGRIIALFGKEHKKLWDIVWECLQKNVPEDQLTNTKTKLDSFAAGYGTVLFFNEEQVTTDLQAQFPLYAQHFPSFADQSNGMLQYVIWSALDMEGLGISLQHYNPLIDEEVKKEWNVPSGWKLMSQMVFGSRSNPPAEKDRITPEDKVKIFK